jgi:N-acylglucosamine 2-epimerase
MSQPINKPMNRDELLETYRDGLLLNTLPFWTTHGVDREQGGFFTALERDGTVLDTDKGVWQQGRAAWLFGELYNTVEQRPEWLELCRHGIEFLDAHGFDASDGRMWFHLTRDGRPVRKTRYAFSESFAAIAYGEYAKATGSDQYAEKARKTFERFLDHNFNPPEGLAKFTKHRQTRGIGFPMITINTAQELRGSIGLETADAAIDQAIENINRYHVKPELRCVMETVGPGGELLDHFDGRTLNPGHAIEGAWFIMAEGKHRGDESLIRLGCDMLDWMWDRGWDNEHGGILYFTSVDGRPVQEYWHDMKFWWPHNETIIATLMASLLTGDAKYATWHQSVHAWAYDHFSDPVHGEWFGYLHRDGSVSNTCKGNLWKGPFHFPRMQLVCWKLLTS